MMELLTDPAAWASLATLALLEIVLGVDNVIFLSIVSSRLPERQQPAARRIGLLLALAGRIILLFALSWIIGLTAPFLEVFALEISWRDVILAAGGLFLIFKATSEIHGMLEGGGAGPARRCSPRCWCRYSCSTWCSPSIPCSPPSAWPSISKSWSPRL